MEEKIYQERQKGTKPKTIEMWENRLSKEREKRNKLMAKRKEVQRVVRNMVWVLSWDISIWMALQKMLQEIIQSKKIL